MQDEKMDDIIRDASSQHYPTYDDKAWGKMERLLDKQFPQKKDRRKYLLFLLLFLLLGAGSFFAFVYPKKHTSNSLQTSAIAQNSKQDNSGTSPVSNDQVQNNVVVNSQKRNVQQ